MIIVVEVNKGLLNQFNGGTKGCKNQAMMRPVRTHDQKGVKQVSNALAGGIVSCLFFQISQVSNFPGLLDVRGQYLQSYPWTMRMPHIAWSWGG